MEHLILKPVDLEAALREYRIIMVILRVNYELCQISIINKHWCQVNQKLWIYLLITIINGNKTRIVLLNISIKACNKLNKSIFQYRKSLKTQLNVPEMLRNRRWAMVKLDPKAASKTTELPTRIQCRIHMKEMTWWQGRNSTTSKQQ